jgi:hypothetical protein
MRPDESFLWQMDIAKNNGGITLISPVTTASMWFWDVFGVDMVRAALVLQMLYTDLPQEASDEALQSPARHLPFVQDNLEIERS